MRGGDAPESALIVRVLGEHVLVEVESLRQATVGAKGVGLLDLAAVRGDQRQCYRTHGQHDGCGDDVGCLVVSAEHGSAG